MKLVWNHKTVVFAILILAFVVRLAALFIVEPISNPATWEHEEIANNLLEGRGLYWTFYGTPYRSTYMVLYSLLCSFVYILTNHSFLAMKILQIFISLLTCILIYKISLQLFNKRVATLALLLVGLHPGLVYYCVRMHYLVLAVFMFTLPIFFFLKVINDQHIFRNSILCGISSGLALLTISTIGPFLFFASVIIFLRFKGKGVVAYAVVSVIVISTILTVLPLWVRNYLVFDKVVLTPSDSGLTFWLSYNENATGTNKTLDGKFILSVAPEEFRTKLSSMNEFEQKEYFYRAGVNFIKEHPFESLALFFKKIKYFWWFTPTQGQEYPQIYFTIYKCYWVFIFPMFLLGFYQSFREKGISIVDRYGLFLMIFFFITITLAHASFNLDGRHRWMVEAFILIFSANGIIFLLKHFKLKYRIGG